VRLEAAAGSLVYECDNLQAHDLDSNELDVLQHYIERLEPVLLERGDGRSSMLRSALYFEDWKNLQVLAASHACEHGPLRYTGPKFPEPHMSAPSFTLPRLIGDGQESLIEARGRLAIVTFWATWCTPCLAEYVDLVRISRDHSEVLVVYHILHKDRLSAAREYILSRDQGGVRNLQDPGELVARQYGVHGLPTTFILDRDGTVLPACPTCKYRHLELQDFVAALEQGAYR
jgi:thiol-disulfide isomerase/thioredoxin